MANRRGDAQYFITGPWYADEIPQPWRPLILPAWRLRREALSMADADISVGIIQLLR